MLLIGRIPPANVPAYDIFTVPYFVTIGIQDRASGQLEGLSAKRLKEEEEKGSCWYWWTQTSKVKAGKEMTTT